MLYLQSGDFKFRPCKISDTGLSHSEHANHCVDFGGRGAWQFGQ